MLTLRLAIAACLLSVVLSGQGQFRISGVVADTAGSALAGATVVVVERPGAPSIHADVTGRFDLPKLSPGRYTVRVTLAGFRPQTQVVVLSGPPTTMEIRFTLRLGVIAHAHTVMSPILDDLRQATAVAHIRLDGLAPPSACDDLDVVTAVHEATVLAAWRGTVPDSIQVLQSSAGTCLDGAEVVGEMNSVRAAGSEYVVFLRGAGTRFSGVGNGDYFFPVVEDRVTTQGHFGLAGTVSLEQFRTALERLYR